jgi:hypothetical protein
MLQYAHIDLRRLKEDRNCINYESCLNEAAMQNRRYIPCIDCKKQSKRSRFDKE